MRETRKDGEETGIAGGLALPYRAGRIADRALARLRPRPIGYEQLTIGALTCPRLSPIGAPRRGPEHGTGRTTFA